ncbi:hypothetical protein PybrP1_003400 [[Pythium] brassicae (nom. inval.)]|nr:hypothetical protein PybrP1_003400 [[Pythium] brassicae (nom. inval.)]
MFKNVYYRELLVAFLGLRATSINISRSILIDARLHILAQSTGEYNAATIESGRLISSRINSCWIQSFCQRNNLVAKKKCGMLAVSDEKKRSIGRGVPPRAAQARNDKRSFPTRGLADDVSGVTYRACLKGWMYWQVFGEWVREEMCLGGDPHERP